MPVTFDHASWVGVYPEFARATPAQTSHYFALASSLCDPSDASVITDENVRRSALWALTAHIASLHGANQQSCGGGASGGAAPAGRISSVTEGSVSVSFEMPQGGATASWFMQTQYGGLYWQIVKPYARFVYVPADQPNFEPRGAWARPW